MQSRFRKMMYKKLVDELERKWLLENSHNFLTVKSSKNDAKMFWKNLKDEVESCLRYELRTEFCDESFLDAMAYEYDFDLR